MNPNGGESHPQIEFTPTPSAEVESNKLPEKTSVASPESNPQKQSLQAATQIANDLATPTSTSVTVSASSDDNNAALPAMTPASEGDRIEKEWIEKAKSIIAKTQDDPFEQKEAMSKVKAEYIQKRFNKTIKTDSAKT